MNKIVVIAGPTAVGKTEYAIKAAQAFNGEIVSCDSMQLYKYMDIGSAKPTCEEQKAATHHLVDIIDPRDDFSVAEYQKLAKDKILTLLNENKLPVIAGGTGLYLNSILYDMDFGGGGVSRGDARLGWPGRHPGRGGGSGKDGLYERYRRGLQVYDLCDYLRLCLDDSGQCLAADIRRKD